MIFVRLRAIGEMESVPVNLIAGLLQQIGTPERRGAASIERQALNMPVAKSSVRPPTITKTVRPWTLESIRCRVEKIFLHEAIDPRGQGISAGRMGIDSNSRRSAKPKN